MTYAPAWEVDGAQFYRDCAPGPAFYPNLRRGRPIYLSGVATALPDLVGLGYEVGLLSQPGNSTHKVIGDYPLWAADNGCFAEIFGRPFDVDRWYSWLSDLSVNPQLRWGCWGFDYESRLLEAGAPKPEPMGCLFATAPDVVCDMAATWERSLPWFQPIRRLGFPVALVAQNGLEDFAAAWDDCDRWDCLFIGGGCPRCMDLTKAAQRPVKCGRSDHADWKLSNEARDCAREAQLLGKWVHMGRVNSDKRIRIAASWDVDSVDGTFLGKAPDTNAPRLAGWLDHLIDQPVPPAPTWMHRTEQLTLTPASGPSTAGPDPGRHHQQGDTPSVTMTLDDSIDERVRARLELIRSRARSGVKVGVADLFRMHPTPEPAAEAAAEPDAVEPPQHEAPVVLRFPNHPPIQGVGPAIVEIPAEHVEPVVDEAPASDLQASDDQATEPEPEGYDPERDDFPDPVDTPDDYEELRSATVPAVPDPAPAPAVSSVPAGLRAKAAANLTAIRTVRTLEAEGRDATDDERAALAAWSAWGALPKVFDEDDTDWANVRADLQTLLSDAEWAAARRTTINAHYTPPEVVAAMWEAAVLLGFDGGLVLEPGCGSGNFIGSAPEGAIVTGVELDPTTAAIARHLHPRANIRCEGFERTPFRDGMFDLAIGNVPFGKIVLHDPKHNAAKHTMHNHFIVKSLRLVAPGGLVIMVTSRYTLDSGDSAHRADMAALADLVGAFRLPSGAMKATAGTDVVADVLILRKRDGGPAAGEAWLQTGMVETPEGVVEVNEYFAANPHLVLGTLGMERGMYARDDLTVRGHEGPLGPQLRTAVRNILGIPEPVAVVLPETDTPELPETRADELLAEALEVPAVRKRRPKPIAPRAAVDEIMVDTGMHQEGTILRTDKGFRQVEAGMLMPFEVTPKKDEKELTALLDLRDTVLAVVDAQAATTDDTRFATLQAELNERYDSYVEVWGPINRFSLARTGRVDESGKDRMRQIRPRMGGFGDDPAFHTVLALEHFDADDQTATKADIFSKRVVGPRGHRLTAESPRDALAICLDEVGRVDMERIAELLGVDTDEARSELGDLVWDDPVLRRPVTAVDYLSGDVRAKLAAAERAVAADARWRPNVEALTKVVPDDLGPAEIRARLGAPWVEPGDIVDFIKETFISDGRRHCRVSVDHAEITATWEVSIDRWVRDAELLMTSTWGTPRADAIQLLQNSLNQTPTTVYDTISTPEGDRRVLNQEATFVAREKQQAMDERFEAWVWEDADRTHRICERYNRLFNSVVLPTYDGSHLTLPGLSLSFKPHPHQLDAVWRVLQSPTALLAHPVGAGKTMVVTAAGIESRRLGLVKKPAYVVPNHMLDQFATEMLQMYPQARILVPTKKDMTPGGRKHFVAKCAMGEWDGVVLTHSAFERIPLKPETEAEFISIQVDALRDAKAQSENKMTVKKLEQAAARLENRIQDLLDNDRRDDGVDFESTGIDYLFVDESQAHKNLPFPTKMRSVGGDGSKRAADLDVKLQYLRRKLGDRVVTFSTATPIANSIAEMFVVQKYLRPDRLGDAGVGNFDAWAATFGATVTELELAPDGGSYRMNSRFARFFNVPELLVMFREFADVLTSEDLALATPDVAGGKPATVIVPASNELRAYVGTLVERARAVRQRLVKPDEDNMLNICTDGRKAALDLRMVHLPPDPAGGKVTAAAAQIARIYHRDVDREYLAPNGEVSRRAGSFQLTFCDLGTPREGWNAYDQLKDELVGLGVPGESIRFIHEAKDHRAKAALFAACRSGRVSVLVGSTQKMGIGTNVQTRLVAMHHLDCPWRPDEVEQRDGRGIRQGNQNPEVEVYRYASEGSFDVYMWQTVERKAKFIGQVMRGDISTREIDDISDQALSYAEIKALATGNPMIMEKAGVDNDVARLQRLRTAHFNEQRHIAQRLRESEKAAQAYRDFMGELEASIERRAIPDPFEMVVGTTRYDKRIEAGEAIVAAMNDLHYSVSGMDRPLFEYAGFHFVGSGQRTYDGRELTIRATDAPIVRKYGTKDVLRADAVGITQQYEHEIGKLDERLHAVTAALAAAERDQEAARGRQGQPFDQEVQLQGLLRRQEELEVAMTALEEKDQPPAEAVPAPAAS